jgi:hypothetical protein
MRSKSFLLLIVILGFNCSDTNTSTQQYPRWVGDSSFNPKIDASEFKPCHGDENIYQYFNLSEGPQYLNKKPALENIYTSSFQPVKDTTQNGMIRIRFVVNCQGKAGRFRLLQSNFDYEEVEFDESIQSQLLNITKSISDWQILYKNDKPIDYYMYLIFKIKDGQITEILP